MTDGLSIADLKDLSVGSVVALGEYQLIKRGDKFWRALWNTQVYTSQEAVHYFGPLHLVRTEPTYDVVLMDPPWKYYGRQDKWGAAAKFYPLMDFTDILDNPPPLTEQGVLFLWTTSMFLPDAIKLVEGWGLSYRGIAFVWVKTKADGTPIGAQGVRPSITKPLTEFVVAASWKDRGRPMPLADESVRQTVFAAKREHSRKPSDVMRRIEMLYPDATRLEMYSREPREGWDAWGNEVDKFSPVG